MKKGVLVGVHWVKMSSRTEGPMKMGSDYAEYLVWTGEYEISIDFGQTEKVHYSTVAEVENE
jgi:hypothetical protein